MFLIRILHQEFRELKKENPLDFGLMASNRQPVLYHDELVGSERGPVLAEIIHFLSALFSPFEPLNARAPSRSPHSERVFTVGFDASLGLFHIFTRVRDPDVFYLRGQLVYHCRYSGIGHSILGKRESQEAARVLIGGVYEYTPAHRTFNMLVPPSTCPMKSREEVFDHAECTEGVAAVRVGYCHGMCDYLQA